MEPEHFGKVVFLSEKKSPEPSVLLNQVDNSFKAHEIRLDGKSSLGQLENLSGSYVVVINYSDLTYAIQLVRILRRRDESKPILVVTPEQDVNLILRAYKAGVNDCIESTISPALLFAKIHAWMRWLGRPR